MIHLNVVFLVIRPTLNTIVKILIDASLFVLNKYTSNGLFRACVTIMWWIESMTSLSTRIIKHVYSIDERLHE